ncbi:hypothetical protein A2U01_0112494, partial [Trifolium medium]|nr:hypothetical protein [Trifolium medium]
QKEEEKILVVANNKKKFGAGLKPTGKPFKNHNGNAANRIKNRNPPRGPTAKKHPTPPPRNDW